MVHPEIRALAAYVKIDVSQLMSMIEESCDYNDFYVKVKAVRSDIESLDCEGAWARYWELYSQQ